MVQELSNRALPHWDFCGSALIWIRRHSVQWKVEQEEPADTWRPLNHPVTVQERLSGAPDDSSTVMGPVSLSLSLEAVSRCKDAANVTKHLGALGQKSVNLFCKGPDKGIFLALGSLSLLPNSALGGWKPGWVSLFSSKLYLQKSARFGPWAIACESVRFRLWILMQLGEINQESGVQ